MPKKIKLKSNTLIPNYEMNNHLGQIIMNKCVDKTFESYYMYISKVSIKGAVIENVGCSPFFRGNTCASHRVVHLAHRPQSPLHAGKTT